MDSRLILYIRQQLQNGYSRAGVERVLRNTGFSQELIDEAMKQAQQGTTQTEEPARDVEEKQGKSGKTSSPLAEMLGLIRLDEWGKREATLLVGVLIVVVAAVVAGVGGFYEGEYNHTRYEKYVSQGWNSLDTDNATHFFHMALEETDRFSAPYFGLAEWHSRKGDYEKAMDYAEEALQRRIEPGQKRFNHTGLYAWATRLAVEADKYETAERYARKHLTNDTDCSFHISLGKALLGQEEYSKSFGFFRECMESSFSEEVRSKALYGMGRVKYEQEEYEEAHGYFGKALNHSHDIAFVNMQGQALFHMGDYIESSRRLARVLDHSSGGKWVMPHIYVGKICIRVGRADAAFSYLWEARELEPSHREKGALLDTEGYAHYVLGNYTTALSRFRDARAEYKKADEETGFDERALGWTLLQMNETQDALEAFEDAEQLPSVMRGKGLAYLREGNLQEARELLKGSVRREAGWQDHWAMARLHDAAGETVKARRQMERALKQDFGYEQFALSYDKREAHEFRQQLGS